MADMTMTVPINLKGPGDVYYITKLFKEVSSGVYVEGVTIVGADTPVALTGDIIVDTLGALDNAAVTNPAAASATIPSLLRGGLATALAGVVDLDAIIANLGGLDATAVTDPAAVSASHAALLRGIMTQLATVVSSLALIGAADDDAGDPTMIGLLKQIVINTTIVPV